MSSAMRKKIAQRLPGSGDASGPSEHTPSASVAQHHEGSTPSAADVTGPTDKPVVRNGTASSPENTSKLCRKSRSLLTCKSKSKPGRRQEALLHMPSPLRSHTTDEIDPTTTHLLPESNDGIQHVAAGTASSCQLFNMFKAMAAGCSTPANEAVDVEVDTDSEPDDHGAGTEVEKALPLGGTEPDASIATSSTATLRPDVTDTGIDKTRRGPTDPEAEVYSEPVPASAPPTEHSRWLDATNKDMGSKLAALSMNAFSPFGDDDANSSKVDPTQLPPPVESPTETESAASSTITGSSAANMKAQQDIPESFEMGRKHRPAAIIPSVERARFLRDEYDENEKLQTIIDEFGRIDDKMVNSNGTPAAPETLLAESQGTLFKGVMMIGNLHLTNYRLMFHAILPPDSAFLTPSRDTAQTEEAANARFARPDVIKAGPVTIHRDGLLKSKKRVWMELSPDMITTYPSGDEAGRVRPLYSVLLSSVVSLAPFEECEPRDFYVTYESPDGQRTSHFSVDNEQSAITWRRHFEGALFRYARQRFRASHLRDGMPPGEDLEESQWTLLRCCVPLDLARVDGVGEYHGFSTLIGLSVNLDTHDTVTWHPEEVAAGNYKEYHKTPSPRPPERSSTADSSSSRLSRLLQRSSTRSRESSPDSTQERRTTSKGIFASPLRSIQSAGTGSRDGTETPDSERSSMDNKRPIGYIDSQLPRNMRFDFNLDSHDPSLADLEPESTNANMFEVLVAVLNDQEWFIQALNEAVDMAHQREYKPGVRKAKFTLDIGGYDCLANDDDIEAHRDRVDNVSDTSSEAHDEDEDADKPRAVVEARKREKATMAAKVFGLREDEGIWLKRCYLLNGLVMARGHLILTPRFICFWRRATVGSDIKLRFAVADIKGAEKCAAARPGTHGMAIKVHGHSDINVQFWKAKGRDETLNRINELCAANPLSPTDNSQCVTDASRVTTGSSDSSRPSNDEERAPVEIWEDMRGMTIDSDNFLVNPELVRDGGDKGMRQALDVLAPPPDLLVYPTVLSDEALSYMPFVANRPWMSKTGWNVRLAPRRFTMLTIGSRGDVQPYIALALRLMKDGHTCVIVTHDEFKKWIESYGIEHRQAGGDPTALMKLSTEHAMFSPGFFKEALGSFRKWLDELLIDSWNACQDADVLIESPSAMAGVHIAEGLAKQQNRPVPYFRAFTMPWTRTSAYPQAFMVPTIDMGPSFNYSTYVLFDNIMWRASSGQINRWRKKYLGLKATDQSSLSISKVPFLYNFSPAVVPKPLDWDDDIVITGYWNLENSDMEWTPPDSLVEFMGKAQQDGKPIVYIGFGSIIVPDPTAVTKSIIKGVEKAGVRAIIAKGWSARGADGKKKEDDVEFPASCYSVDKVPHSWLFPRIQAAMHHGGAGTTGASLRAGIPTVIKPWFGDQYFWAQRVTKLGVGLKVASLRSDDIAYALGKATSHRVMIEKAVRIGERIRAESGVDAGVNAIHFNIVRAARDRRRLKKLEQNRDQCGSSKFTLPHLNSLLPNRTKTPEVPAV